MGNKESNFVLVTPKNRDKICLHSIPEANCFSIWPRVDCNLKQQLGCVMEARGKVLHWLKNRGHFCGTYITHHVIGRTPPRALCEWCVKSVVCCTLWWMSVCMVYYTASDLMVSSKPQTHGWLKDSFHLFPMKKNLKNVFVHKSFDKCCTLIIIIYVWMRIVNKTVKKLRWK